MALMQAALLLALLFPPPAAGALDLAGRDGARARSAADGGKAFGVQGVDRNVALAGETQHRLARPIEERIELENAAVPIDTHQADVAARVRLAGPDARNPGRGAGQCAIERLDLANVAAGHARVARMKKPVDALLGEGFDRGGLRIDRADANAVTPLALHPDIV